jgi:nitrogen regulatory protein P-II 1
MELLVCIVKNHRQVEDILTGFLDVGIRGATVLDAQGMGQIIATSIPIFAGFKSLFPVGGGSTYMILSVLEQELVSKAVSVIEEVTGDFDKPGAGFLFTMPVSTVKGMAKEIN